MREVQELRRGRGIEGTFYYLKVFWEQALPDLGQLKHALAEVDRADGSPRKCSVA